MLGKIKKGFGDAKASTEIETEYLMAKNKKNFDHPAENGIRIKAYEDAFTAADDFYDRVRNWTDQYKDLINAEQKMIEKMNASSQLATISSIFSTFTASQQNLVSLRQQYLGKVQEYIQSPAKKYIGDQTPIRNKIDQTNKAWIELRYWRKKNKSEEEREAKIDYEKHTEELFRLFDNSIDTQVAQWVKYFADFEVEFFTNAINVAPRV